MTRLCGVPCTGTNPKNQLCRRPEGHSDPDDHRPYWWSVADGPVPNEATDFALPSELPIPMLLTCPSCGERHVDAGDFATKPHHTHACQTCGMCWRPAIVATVGVQFLPGFKDGAS